MNDYRYKLEPYTDRNSRYICPECGKPNQFTRYIDTKTGTHLAEHVGICNRANKCGYHYTPGKYMQDTDTSYPVLSHGDPYGQGSDFLPLGELVRSAEGNNTPTYIDKNIFKKSLSNFDKNNFVHYLYERFDKETVNKLIKEYNIGTSSRWNGGTTIFWQVDSNKNIRTGKLIKYNAETGKRSKNNTNWVHSVSQLSDFNLKQCFFGEHLLDKYPNKPVGIVESEKTAIIASMYLPELVWLASGGVNNISSEKVKVLRSREVILFPDASSSGKIYNCWNDIAKTYGFTCSDFIERNATDKQKSIGIDTADLLESVTMNINTDDDIDIPSHHHNDASCQKLHDNCETGKFKISTKYSQQTEPSIYLNTTPQIPYNTPSPVAIIDSKIDTDKIFNREELIIKNRVFTTLSGNLIELVGIRDYGFCKDYKSHKEQKGYCRECLLNCLHIIKINGKLQEREYTQLEILMMQDIS